ncbi:MAG: shikimate dehydrogenase [Halobacteriaceae archaeon]
MDVYGLVGNPVEHSLSPPMHEAAYDVRDIDATYVTFEPTSDALERAINGAAALGIAGLNVTVPFKEAVLEFVEPDGLARQVGAANTIAFDGDGTPRGYNTDVAGVQRAFTHHDVEISGASGVVVGAGGAGRAAAWALTKAGADVTVVNRTVDRAHDLADEIGATAAPLEMVSDQLAAADILVQATTVGMHEDASPVPAEALHEDLAVLDAVYEPLETRLLRDAAAAGATTIDGAWMLLFQGVVAFEHWLDQPAPVAAMNDALRSRL